MYYNEFRSLGIECQNKTSGNQKVVCPKCDGGSKKEKSLQIYFETGVYTCYRSKCGWKGSVSGIKKEYSRPTFKNNTVLSNQLVSYFASRGISQKTIEDLKISSNGAKIQFNYFRGEELINIKSKWERDGKKMFSQHVGAEKIFYNLNSIIGKKKVIITEGEMDVIALHECGLNEYGKISVDQGAGLPNSNLDGKLECLRNCAHELDEIEAFYICTDKDAPGVYLQEELIRRLGSHRCWIVELPQGIKDANQVLMDGQNSADAKKQTLIECVRNAKPVPLKGIHSLDIETEISMLDDFKNGRKMGHTTYFEDIDKHFKVLAGEMTVITGLPNDGKSEFVRQLMTILAVKAGWKWACFVPEDFPVKDFFDNIICIYHGKNSDVGYKDRMSEEEYCEGILFVRRHFFCIYPEYGKDGVISLPTNDWINKRISFLKLKHGVNAYVKDPWNKIMHQYQTREDQYLQKELSKEGFFAKDFDAAWYIAHPTKVERRGKGGPYVMPTEHNISGGSMWNNMADNILVGYRPNKHMNPLDKDFELHVRKVRRQKQVGRPGKCLLTYDIAKHRYFDEFGNNPLSGTPVQNVEVDDDAPF